MSKGTWVIYQGSYGINNIWFSSLEKAIEFALFWKENTYNLVIE